jgi:glutaminyl-tRNA synthetase
LKPKGVVHWVDASAGVPVQVRDYQRLFKVPNPGGDTLLEDINPDSVKLLNAVVEPAMMTHESPRFQFERQGYFCKDSTLPGVFNKTVSLREGF